MEITQNWIGQLHVSFTLTYHQRQVSDLEFTRLISLEDLGLWVNLNVFILDGELGAVDLDFLISGVLNDDRMRDTLTNWAAQIDSFNFRVVFHSNGKVVEDVLS